MTRFRCAFFGLPPFFLYCPQDVVSLSGGKINRLVDYATIVDADVYVCCHTHMPAVAKMEYFRPVPQNGTLVRVEKTFVNTASALVYGGYGDKQGYTPASNAFPVIELHGDGGDEKAVFVRI